MKHCLLHKEVTHSLKITPVKSLMLGWLSLENEALTLTIQTEVKRQGYQKTVELDVQNASLTLMERKSTVRLC